MLNIQATLNGEDYGEVSVTQKEFNYASLKDQLKIKLTISSDDEIEVFNNENLEISGIIPEVDGAK